MKKNIINFILMSILLVSCASQTQNSSKKNLKIINQTAQGGIIPKEIIVQKKIEKSEEQLRFKISNIEQKAYALAIDVQYGGGCVDEHIFDLYTNGIIDKNGVIDFYLLHQTTDNCKMLLMRTQYFDISKVINKKKMTHFRINDGEKFEFKQ